MTDVAQIVQRLDEIEKRLASAERERDEYRTLYIVSVRRNASVDEPRRS